MRGFVGSALAAALFALSAATAATAHNPQRLYVSPSGNDSNDCSRASPCRTFAGAYNKGNAYAGSEINCLEPGGYGQLTITKSFSIVCDAKLGGIVANNATSGTSIPADYGILVNAGPNDEVYLRGLNIDGTGGAIDGSRSNARAGIRVVSAGAVFIEDCVIRNFNSTTDGGFGIQIAPTVALKFVISRCSIFSTGLASINRGASIQVRPSAAVAVSGVIDQVTASKSVYGFAADADQAAANVNLVIRDSVTNDNFTTGVIATTTNGTLNVLMERVSSTNSTNGVATAINGSGVPTVRIDDSSVTGNTNGIVSPVGNVQSYGTNKIVANTNNGAVSLTPGGLR